MISLIMTHLSFAESRHPDMQINNTTKLSVINEAIDLINMNYVFPDSARKISIVMKNNVADKKYDNINMASLLAKQLTTDLQSISHDKHLQVIYSYERLSPNKKKPSITEELKNLPFSKNSENFGFQQVNRLNGNVGYLSFNFFAPPELAAKTAAAAMYFLSNTDALIIDLRDNHGGDPAMVAFLASYFFNSEPVHLNDVYWRSTNSIQQSWTLPYVPGKRYLNKKVYLLTNHATFSGAEEFAYDLKNMNRAMIIGERTAGGANPSYIYTINEHFAIWIPGGRAINPITKTNWENTGVKPDIEIPQNEAFKEAYILALKDIIKKTTDPDKVVDLEKLIKAPEQALDTAKK